MAEVPNINMNSFEKVSEIANSDSDSPVLMLNLNTYFDGRRTMSSAAYGKYNEAVKDVLREVEGKVIWRSPVYGQPVGVQIVDEILAVWYPTHKAFVELKNAPSSSRFVEAKNKVVKNAIIHRCNPYTLERI